MYYDLSSPLQLQQAKTRFAKLESKGAIIELKEKSVQRTLQQNKYLHLTISYFASQYGESADYVKRNYFKIAANSELFVKTKHDPLLERDVKYLISSADLSKDDMTTAIERWRNWSSKVAGIYIPPAVSIREIAEMEIEVERNKDFV